MEQTFIIPRTSDQGVVDAFRELAAKFPVNSGHLVAGSVSFSVGSAVARSDDLDALLALKSYVISQMTIGVYGQQITYWRGRKGEPKSPVFDEVTITPQGQSSGSNQERMNFAAAVGEVFRANQIDTKPSDLMPSEQALVLAAHATSLERLEQLNEKLIERSSEFRANLEKDYAQRRQELELQLDARKIALDEESRVKDQAFSDRETKLQETLKRIDDRNNTHVRREIRDRMLDDVKSRIAQFGVSAATERKRLPVLVGIVILAVTFLIGAILAGTEIAGLDKQLAGSTSLPMTPYYLLWLRLGLFCFGLFGSLLYFVKWQNKWAEEHSTAEFQLQQFYIDVNRANWVIESCLEWRKDTKSAIPKELLESVTRNLFTIEKKASEQVIHPADELASALLGTASNLKLKVAGNEIEFGKPGKIAKNVKIAGDAS